MEKGLNPSRVGFQVLAAILLGVIAGIVFGPLCSLLKPIGDAFIMLLQMVVLPYICFSLIHGLGSISPQMGKGLFKNGCFFLVALWLLGFLMIFFLSQITPEPLVAFVDSKGARQESILTQNFLTYLVPENPFYDLANNVVPAVAIFGLILGTALMHLENKEPFLSLLERINESIEKIFRWLAILAPVGVFAHIAVAFGTVRFEDLFKLEFYVICFILASVFFTFWILPAILSSLTPLTFKDAIKGLRIVCLLPFATAVPTIAFPFINYILRKYGRDHKEAGAQFHSTSQTVLPVAYSFGQIGNGMILFFILFISFYYRHPLIGSEKALLSFLTIPLSIGSAGTSVNAVTFLIDQLGFPKEAIELYTETMAITLNFQVLMSVGSIFTLVSLTLFSYYNLLKFNWMRLFSHLGIPIAILAVCCLTARHFMPLDDNYEHLFMNLSIREAIPNPVEFEVLEDGQTGAARDGSKDPLEQILRSGVLKVGYDPYNIPYCYWNDKHELVGYDVAAAFQLARDLDCKIQFVLIHIDRLADELNEGAYDIAMAAVLMNEERIEKMAFSHPYTEQNNVLVVPLSQKSGFINLQEVIAKPGLKIGARGGYSYVLERHFPLAVPFKVTDIDLELLSGQASAWIWSRTPAFVWCLSHPGFVLVDYGGLIGKRYFAYPVRSSAVDFVSFLNNWLILKEQSGFKTQMHRYWIEGEPIKEKARTWSLINEYLHKKSD